MNIPKYSLENRKVIYFFLAILLIGGVISFFKLPKKEDAPFVIKTAVSRAAASIWLWGRAERRKVFYPQ